MNYQNIYNNLMEKRKASPFKGYTEKHHIIPRCLGGSDDENNLVNLSGREHFIAHRLLTKFNPYPGLKQAFGMMCLTNKGRDYNVSSRLYELGKTLLSEAMTGREMPQETRDKIRQTMLGKQFTDIHIQRMCKPKSEEAKNNIAKAKVGELNPMYGTISPTRDIPHTQDTKDLISAKTKAGTDYPQCPHCGVKVNKGNALRWHYDKCKFKDPK